MVDADEILKSFVNISALKILVIGDFIVDTYCTGAVNRISPEAPVMIFREQNKNLLLGGAANVALGIKNLGAQVKFVSKVGDDDNARAARKLLEKEGIDSDGLFIQKDYKTPNKMRLIANKQQVLRIDHESTQDMPEYLQDCVYEYIEQVVDGVDLITLSDYAKGFFSKRLLFKIINLANRKGCRVIVDPKGADFFKYKGAYLLKPNESEAYSAANLKSDQPIDSVFLELKKTLGIERLLVTRSEKGMTYFNKNARHDFKVRKKQVIDVTGAGDTCLSIISVCMALNLCMKQAIELANMGALEVIEKVGCYSIGLSHLISLVFKHCDKTVISLEDLEIVKSLEMMDDFVLLRIDERISDLKVFIEGIYQIKSVGQKIFALVDKDLEDQFYLLLAIEKIDVVFKIDSCNFDPIFDKIYTYSNAKFVQNQSSLC